MSWGGTRRSLFFSYQPSQPGIAESGLSIVEKDKTRLSPADVWNFLLSLTQTDVPTSSHDAQKSGKLKHFKASDFEQTNAAFLGEGASYRVERGSLVAPPNGKSELVAVKRLNIFRMGGATDNSQMSSAALQSSIATIMKELRILTHSPLHGHRNIATLLGYRSEFISADSEGGPSPQRNFEISLVAEFAPHGTLIDFVSHRIKNTSQEVNDKLSKAAGNDGNGFFVDLLHSNSGKEASRCDLLAKARFMHDIASGLQALHDCGVAHGDVKLENTLVFDDPYRGQIAKLSDFGHALLTVNEGSTSEQRYLGTMPLVAPEVWRARSSILAESSRPINEEDFYKCDIFSYGLLVWELLLDGRRYTSTLEDAIFGDADAERWAWLDKLPKDELLRRALVTLQKGSQANDRVLIDTLGRILGATLRDSPGERKDINGLIRIFREQSVFRDDGARSEILSKDMPKPKYLNSSILKDWTVGQTDEPILQMPRSVQSDLVSQIRTSTGDFETVVLRRSAIYDLAMCYFSGFGVEAVDIYKALALLVEAAELGSSKALSISFRLHYALVGEVPASLLELDDPVILVEKELLNIPAEAYFAERVRHFEILSQREALRQQYDIFYCGQLLVDSVYLSDADQALSNTQRLDLQQLTCVCQPGDQGSPVIQGLLIHTAIRLGLLPLVKFLLSIHQPSPSQSHGSIFSHIEGETALCAACRGGHLEMLEYLISEGAESTITKSAVTALHWLMMFPVGDMEKALELLIATPQGYLCFACDVVAPGVDMHHTHLLGTPLEFAIAVNNVPLVQLLLAAQPSAKHKNHTNCVTCLGWQDSTFRRAVSSHLYSLLPVLLPHELTYRRSRPLFGEKARFLRSVGKPEIPPFGLFDIPHTPNPIFMLLMHGRSSLAAMETSIDCIVESGICSLNDEDSDGSTALTHAVRVAPCDINTDIISALISRGARFGVGEGLHWILTICIAKRNNESAGTICRLLLQGGLFPLSTELLSAAVWTGNDRIVEEFLSFSDQGRKLDVNAAVAEEGDSIPMIHVALLVPNCAKLINLLLDYGADIDAQWTGRTALQLVICSVESDGDVIDLLIRRGALLCPDGTSILHIAAGKRAYVNGIHVMYRLLEHEKVRELLNFDCSPSSDEQDIRPLHVACLAGNLEAVQALLGRGAEVKRSEDDFELINLSRTVGRRPDLSTMWDGDIDDEDAVYAWRLDVEGIILALLGRSDPSHGRTELHVAVELGNFKRVVELVTQGGFSLWDGDRNSITPLGFLEDANVAKEAGESEVYITNLKRIWQYLMEQTIRQTSTIVEDPKALEALLETFPISESETQETKKARADFQTKLEELRIKDKFPLGSGLDEPATLESKYNQLLAEQKMTLGETHIETLSTMTSLSKVYCMQMRYEEAEKLQMQVLRAREAQGASNDPDLYISYGDRIRILCSLGRYEDAKAYAYRAVIPAIDTFGMKHPVVLSLSCDTALLDECAGNVAKAVESQELTLQVYEGLESPEQCRLAVLELKRSLISNYCSMDRFGEASNLVLLGHVAATLEYVPPEEFLESFHCLIFGIALKLDEHQRWEDSEPVYAKVVEIVQQVHGERKSYCIYTALRLLAEHYQKRSMWKEECEVREKLVKYLKSSFGQDHLTTLENMLNLAQVYEKLNRMLEANLLHGQAVQMLEATIGSEHLQTLMGKLALCTSCRTLDQLEKSERAGREAFEGYSRVLGDEDERTLNAADQLAITLAARGKFVDATELQKRVIEVFMLVHGEVHEKTRKGVENLCATLLRQRRFDEAEVQGQRCLAIGLELHGENSNVVSHCLYVLAQCKRLSGDIEKAIELFLQSIDVERLHHGGNNAVSLLFMRCLSKLYLDTEQYSEAERILRELLAEAPRIYGGEKEDEVQIATSHLGFVCEEMGRPEEAVNHYEAAVKAARCVYGDWHDETMNCISDLVRVYIILDRMRDAHMLAREILRYKSEKLGTNHEETVEAKGNLGSIYCGLCMWPEAERMQRDVLRHLQATDPENPENEDTIPWMDALSWSCSKQGRYEEAEKLGRTVLEYQTKTLGPEEEETVKAMINLAYILVDAGKHEQAAELNAKALNICHPVKDPLVEQLLAAMSQLAYILFHQDKLDAAEAAQLQVLDQKPEDADELEFLFKIYVKMERFGRAEEVGKQALGVRREALENDGLHDWDVLAMMANMTELYASMKRWEEARNFGERTLEAAQKREIKGLYRHSEVVVMALQALKLVYEGVGNEEELLKISLAIKDQKDDQRERRRRHKSILEAENSRFQRNKEVGLLEAGGST